MAEGNGDARPGFWAGISTLMRHRSRQERTADLVQAYRATFDGTASADQARAVLVDLMDESELLRKPARLEGTALAYKEGKSDIVRRIMDCLSLTPSELQAVGQAARGEYMTKTEEGGDYLDD